jgi:hypothetical protein
VRHCQPSVCATIAIARKIRNPAAKMTTKADQSFFNIGRAEALLLLLTMCYPLRFEVR